MISLDFAQFNANLFAVACVWNVSMTSCFVS